MDYHIKSKAFKVLDEFLFVNLQQKSTGLPMVIWARERAGNRHGPRLEVSRTHRHRISARNTVSVTVSNCPKVIPTTDFLKPKDFELVRRFILMNKSILQAHWKREIDTLEFCNRMIKYSEEVWAEFVINHPEFQRR